MRYTKFLISRFIICFIIILIRRLIYYPLRNLLSRCLKRRELSGDTPRPEWKRTKLEILLINGKLPEKTNNQDADYTRFYSIAEVSAAELINYFRIYYRRYFNEYHELKDRLTSKTNNKLKRWKDTVNRFFTLLFGLINSDSGQIFKVIFGTSSTRIH